MIKRGKELIRIAPGEPKKIEYSLNDGRNWMTRFTANDGVGLFQDLMDNGKEVLATTTKGLFYSLNDGRNWMRRR